MHIRVKEVAVAGLVERGTIQIEGFGCSDVEVELNVFINSNNVYMMHVFLRAMMQCC